VNQPTEQTPRAHQPLQLASLRAATDLTALAVSLGADRLPMWFVHESGYLRGSFSLDGAPRPAEFEPWRLAIGEHETERWQGSDGTGAHETEELRFRFRGIRIGLTVTYPLASAVLGVAA